MPNERSTRKAATRPLSPAHLARVFHSPSLLYFIAVADTLSVREASRRLNVASSAVARQIAQLESALGLSVFDRRSKRLILTEAGEILIRHARKLRGSLEAAVSELDLLRGLETGTVRIASVESVGLTLLPGLIARFSAQYPKLRIEVALATSTNVIGLVVEQRADIGLAFIAKPLTGVLVAAPRDATIGAVMAPTHPLAAEARVTFSDCCGHRIAVPSRGVSIRDLIDPLLQRYCHDQHGLVEASSLRLLLELVKAGNFVSFATMIGIEHEIGSGKIVYRSLADPDLPRNHFGIVIKKPENLPFAPAAFFSQAKAFFSAGELVNFDADPPAPKARPSSDSGG